MSTGAARGESVRIVRSVRGGNTFELNGFSIGPPVPHPLITRTETKCASAVAQPASGGFVGLGADWLVLNGRLQKSQNQFPWLSAFVGGSCRVVVLPQ